MGLRCGILLGRGAEATATALQGAREAYIADGKPTEAIDQALLLLASVPPERPPQGTAAAAAGSGTPAGADAGGAAQAMQP